MRSVAIIICILIGWLTVALGVMLPGRIDTAAVPMGTEIPEGISIIGATGSLLILRSDAPDYVRALYAAGALFVLPARQKTCIDLQRKSPAA
ncbi:MAG: hypothetical protein ABJ327_24625 [Litoreibacter sp.]